MRLAPEILKNVFSIIENPYDLKKEAKFKSRNVHTAQYDIETTSFVAPRFGAAFQEFKGKVKFGIRKTAHANFAKITSIK